MSVSRNANRQANELRPITIELGVNPYAEGSAGVSFGNTQLLVTASVEQERPRWMQEGQGGWITAEYGMLPRATHTRSRREAAGGKQGGRTLEIQRLIGRALRQSVDLKALEGITIRLDCDVIVADGGTRTAAISGGWAALYQAISVLQESGVVAKDVSIEHIVAISVGRHGDSLLLDLNYEEDSSADFDMNIVFNSEFELIELQGTAERAGLSREQLNTLLELGEHGCKQILEIQKEAISQL